MQIYQQHFAFSDLEYGNHKPRPAASGKEHEEYSESVGSHGEPAQRSAPDYAQAESQHIHGD